MYTKVGNCTCGSAILARKVSQLPILFDYTITDTNGKIILCTLEFLIIVGLRLLIFGYFSPPYSLIRDPTLIFICKYESEPTLICTSTLCHTLLKKVILHQNWSSVQELMSPTVKVTVLTSKNSGTCR